MKKGLAKGLSAALAVTMVTSLAACGSSKTAETIAAETKAETAAESKAEGESQAEESGVPEVSGEITFSWWGGDSRHEATEKAVEAFMKKYPNVTVKTEYGAWSGWEEKQALNISSGNGADLMQINWNWIDNYSQGGTNFVDLYQYGDIIDLTQFPQETLDQCSVDGKLMGIPISNTGCLFFWNAKTFETIGCDIPTDTESLMAAGQKFKEYGDDYYPLAIDNGFSHMVFLVYYLESVYGKPWVENGEMQYTEEEIQTGMEFMKELEDNHVIPTMKVVAGDMADSLDKNPKWIDGKYAGTFVWDASSIKMADAVEESVNVEGQTLVQGDYLKFGDYNGGYTKISMAYGIPSSSQNPEAAATLLNYLLNDPEGVEICGLERGVPLSKAGVAVIEEKNIGDPVLIQANKAALEYCKFPLDPKFDSADLKASPDGVYEKVFGKLSSDDYTPEEAAKALTEGVDEVLGN